MLIQEWAREIVLNQAGLIVKREGGFANSVIDRGGITKYGITKKALKEYLMREVTDQDIKDLTPEQAAIIMTELYAIKPKINKISYYPLFSIVFDASVHHGPKRAIKMLQRVIGEIDDDGYFGIISQQRLNDVLMDNDFKEEPEYNYFLLLTKYTYRRQKFMFEIAENDPTQIPHIKGWVLRAMRLLI